jgi:hypothetical protein
MAPLSAVAAFVLAGILGLTTGGWITGSPKLFGLIYIVCGLVFLVDAFWVRSARWVRRSDGATVSNPG